MPMNYARRLTGHERTASANRHLGAVLAFVAGAINAGGFLAVGQYTSHMTGIVSSLADHLALGATDLAFAALGALLSFLAGSMTTALIVNWVRRRSLRSVYAAPLLLEALLLLIFGMLGARLQAVHGMFVPATVMLLCFIMGLQNAVISKVSRAEIRTTHVTGIVTDLGIELGKLLYWNGPDDRGRPRVEADKPRMQVLGLLLGSFFAGAAGGALAFSHLGYVSTLPLAIVLLLLAAVPAIDDLRMLRA